METQVLYGLKAAQTSLNGFKPNQQSEMGLWARGLSSFLAPLPSLGIGAYLIP